METNIGLTPEEMVSMFNRMYLDVWEKTKDKIRYTVQIKDNSTGKIVYTTHIYGNGGKIAKTLSKDNTSSKSYNFYFSIYSGSWSGQHVTARAYFTD